MEVKPADSGAYRYHSWEAVKNLYDYTNRKNPDHLRVTTMRYKRSSADPSKRVRAYDKVGLDKPIRTLVVGVVGNPEDPAIKNDPLLKSQVEEMRENLNRMARAGQGVDPYDKSSEVKAYFADDVPSLLDAVNEALLFINDSVTEQTGKGSVPVSPSMDGDKDAVSMYQYSYRIMRTNQWEGLLTRYEAVRGADGSLALTPKWELGREIRSARGNRNLRYWGGSANGFVRLAAGDTRFRDLAGMDASRMDPVGLPVGAFSKKSPHDAMYEWLQGYDHSYSKDRAFERSSMLSDMGASGVAFVGDPTPVDSLPGYLKWANDMGNAPQPPMLYAQTNDGILHAVDPHTGNEAMAILPPPTLVPSRLATLKTSDFQGKLRWIDVNEPEGKGKLRSNAAYVLDGPLLAKRFDMSGNGTGWGTFLLGTTGRGGNGLYMMDVTRHGAPKFMWYREKIGGQLAAMDANQREPVFEDRSSLAPSLSSYMKLGFNAPKPAVGVTGQLMPHQDTRNIVVVPGGVMTDADLSKNGGEGAVLLIADPEDGSIVRAFDSDSLAREPFAWRSGGGTTGSAPYMGMMTSEPTLYKSDISPYLTGKIFAADNRGNIFCVPLEEDDGSNGVIPIPANRWKARTVATLQRNSSSGTSDASYSIPHGVAAIKDFDGIWLAGGTADVIAKVSGSLPDGVLANKSQMIFAFRTNEAQQGTLTRDDLKELDSSNASALAKSDNKEGWYMPLSVGVQGKFREYVSAKPTLSSGTLFISTFIQKAADPDEMDICRAVRTLYGDSRLYALDVRTGAPNLWVDPKDNRRTKYVTMSGVKVTGMTQTRIGGKDSLLLTVDNLSGKFDPTSTGQKSMKTVNGADSLVEVELPSGGGSVGMDEGESVILYWIAK
jgi:Tfp pilus tip-associated adhesin PilY1